jgi:uncharacterized phage protein (TIGR01671 family)
MSVSYLQFRFWCPVGKAFISDYKYSGRVDELFDEKEYDILIPQQCTGLKDKNGKLAYEGDVLELTLDKKIYKGIIKRDSNILCNMDIVVEELFKPVKIFSLTNVKKSAIIGHIYECKTPI